MSAASAGATAAATAAMAAAIADEEHRRNMDRPSLDSIIAASGIDRRRSINWGNVAISIFALFLMLCIGVFIASV